MVLGACGSSRDTRSAAAVMRAADVTTTAANRSTELFMTPPSSLRSGCGAARSVGPGLVAHGHCNDDAENDRCDSRIYSSADVPRDTRGVTGYEDRWRT